MITIEKFEFTAICMFGVNEKYELMREKGGISWKTAGCHI